MITLTYSARASRVRAFPELQSLPGYAADPRVAANLLDGVNATSDDLHAWLAPYTPGRPHLVAIDLPVDVSATDGGGGGGVDGTLASISMLRVFNYNKSRVHAARGVRACEMYVDRYDGDDGCAV